MKKIIFLSIWVFVLLVAFFVTVKTTPIPFVLSTQVRLFSFVQRNLGLIALNFIFLQILIGAFIKPLSKMFGVWIYKFHIIEGIIAYILVFLHPIFYLLSLKFSGHGFDPYIAFINACLLCKTPYDYFLTIGRISFWLLTIGVFAAIFRKTSNWLTKHWKNLHLVNYLVFLAVAIHGFFIGSDFRSIILILLTIAETLIVLGILVFIQFPKWLKDFKAWINS